MDRSIELFQQSISDEFRAVKNRVRNLIGHSHWGEEGRYKEIILMNMLKKLLPKHLSVGTGFVIGVNDLMTKQIDIIIYDNRFPLIFSEGDFVICSNQNTVGIIEVKTKIYLNQIETVIKKSHDNGMIVGNNIFNGIFSYDNQLKLGDPNIQGSKNLENALKQYNGFINHISFGENLFLKYWIANESEYYSLYNINRFSFPYFISNLVEVAYRNTIDNSESSRINMISAYLYGMENGKESQLLRNIMI